MSAVKQAPIQLKSSPVTFTGEEVRAVLEGRKTQFREVIEGPIPDLWNNLSRRHIARFAKIQPGAVLRVRETWAIPPDQHSEEPYVIFRATEEEWINNPFVRWQSPATMPEEYSRLFLQVTAVTVGPIQEVTAEDVLAEGIEAEVTLHHLKNEDPNGSLEAYLLDKYVEWWDRVNGPKGEEFATNPWAVVFQFRPLIYRHK